MPLADRLLPWALFAFAKKEGGALECGGVPDCGDGALESLKAAEFLKAVAVLRSP